MLKVAERRHDRKSDHVSHMYGHYNGIDHRALIMIMLISLPVQVNGRCHVGTAATLTVVNGNKRLGGRLIASTVRSRQKRFDAVLLAER